MKKLLIPLAVMVVLCMIWWAVQAQSQQTNSARQMWEYKTIQLVGSPGDWGSWYEDNVALPSPVNPTAKRTALGNAGWELVTVATYVSTIGTDTYTSSVVQFFKRPK
jgi:hypothetical protein